MTQKTKLTLKGDDQAYECPACLSENTRFEAFWEIDPPHVTRDMHWFCYSCDHTWLQVIKYSLTPIANHFETDESL